jgi:hypothetical protein
MQQIIARFQFHQDRAPEFCWPGTNFAEMRFDDVDEIIELCQEFEDALVDVIALVNGRIISLATQPLE